MPVTDSSRLHDAAPSRLIADRRRTTSEQMLARVALFAALTFGVLVAAAAVAEERNVLAPYRFRAPGEELDAVERDRAITYRNQLKRQQFQLDREAASGRLDPLERRLNLDTQSELERMNEVVRPSGPAPLRLPSSRPLPSLPQPIVPKTSP